jgi:hypothetical protein
MGEQERSLWRFCFGPHETKGRRCTVARTKGGGAGVLRRKMMGIGLVTGKKRIRKQARAGAWAEIGLGRAKGNEKSFFLNFLLQL